MDKRTAKLSIDKSGFLWYNVVEGSYVSLSLQEVNAMISNKTIEELVLSFNSFDLESALTEIVDWYAELNDGTLESQIKRDVLDGVVDLIIDNIN